MTRGFEQRLGGKILRGCAGAAVLALMAACSAHAPTRMAAADPKNGDGIGGTGITTAQVNTRGDGIGGTGISHGNTGVLGTITGFGSILVNGLKLDFDHTTKVVTDGKPTTLEALRVGQIVQGVARNANGKLDLDTLEIQHVVTGPISAIDHSGETITVLGQRVRLNLAGNKEDIGAFRTLQVGDHVAVSGLRQADGLIVATRVDETRGEERIMLRGIAAAVTTSSVRIGDLDIPLVAGSPAPRTGERVFVAGRMINGVFTPAMMTTSGPLAFGQDVRDVSLEAYAPTSAGSAGPLVIGGLSVNGAALPAGTNAGDRIIVTGQVAGPDSITATSISSVRTVVTINTARGALRPAATRPDNARPERVAPRPNIERPQQVRPDTPATSGRPRIERPQGVPMV
jgi:hypothetical protein